MAARPARILAVAYGGGHVAMLLPVLRALRRAEPAPRIDLLALTTAARAAREAGESPLCYHDLLHLLEPGERAQALALGALLRDGNTHPDITEAETLAYLGINALELRQRLGVAQAEALWHAHGRQAFHPVAWFARVIKALRPDLVLTTNAPRSEQAALEAAHAAGLPGVALLDLFAPPGNAFAARRPLPERVCVLAEPVREQLLAAGWPPGRIAVTGNPAFDGLHDPIWAERATQLRASLGWQSRGVVLLATQPELRAHPDSPWPAGDDLALAMGRTLRAWAGGHEHAALIVRHHPNHWHRMPHGADTPGVHLSRGADEPIEALLHAADVVVVQASTVGLQAAVAGVPVLSLRCAPSALGGIDYAALGVARGVADLHALPAALDAVLRAPPPAGPWARRVAAADAVAREVQSLLPMEPRA